MAGIASESQLSEVPLYDFINVVEFANAYPCRSWSNSAEQRKYLLISRSRILHARATRPKMDQYSDHEFMNDYYRKGELGFLAQLNLNESHRNAADYYRKFKPAREDIIKALSYLVPFCTEHPLIRIGGPGDGGYLVPDDLELISGCISPGVNNFKDFEDELFKSFGIPAHMCDASSSLIQFKTGLLPGQTFDKLWLEPESNESSISTKDLICRYQNNSSDLLLQMDIEGAEYRNILEMEFSTLSRFRILVIEIHGLDWLGFSNLFLKAVFLPFIQKLNSIFTLVHAHPNNVTSTIEVTSSTYAPKIMELSFIRNDRLRESNYPVARLPHPFDEPNVPKNVEIDLGYPWKV